METIKSYVKKEFFELHEDDWDRDMLISFIQKAANLDTNIHDEIKYIETDDLVEKIADFDREEYQKEIEDIQSLLISRAKEAVAEIISEILDDKEAAECDHADAEREERRISDYQRENNLL